MHEKKNQLNADFRFEIADLPAERRLRGVQLLLGGNGQAAGIGHGDEVAEMPQLHCNPPYLAGMGPAYKVFSSRASRLYSQRVLCAGPARQAGPSGPEPIRVCPCVTALRRRCCWSY